jgi:hypothetical protein
MRDLFAEKPPLRCGLRDWFHGVAYGNGTFVVVGLGGAILTSPDGVR